LQADGIGDTYYSEQERGQKIEGAFALHPALNGSVGFV
jgi:hypothetical protein